MATILLVEDAVDIGASESTALERSGHVILRCRASFGPFGACPMLSDGACSLPDRADLVLFSHGMYSPVDGVARGDDLLRAYREHPRYGALPFLIVSIGGVGTLPGSGPVWVIQKFSHPRYVLAAVEELLATA